MSPQRSTASPQPSQTSLIFEHCSRKRAEVEDFGKAHIGESLSSYWLHVRFGQGVRSRISEINNDALAEITFKNELFFDREADEEVSGYRIELRRPERHHDDRG